MATPVHQAEYVFIRHVLFRVCVVVAICAAQANILPRNRLTGWRFEAYEAYIALVAAMSLNWRAELPSLNGEFFGFRRRLRHFRRGRAQAKLDREHLAARQARRAFRSDE
jgi:hypothetical protein